MNDAADADSRGERDLVDRAKRGDSHAMHQLVDRYAQPLYETAAYLTRSRDDAADAVQETLLAMVRSIETFRGDASFKTWLWAILIRQAIRTRNRRTTEPLPAPPAQRDPRDATDTRMDIHAALSRLPEDHREVLVLRELQGLSYAEMAGVLDVPRGTVESRLHRARAALRDCLHEYAPGAKDGSR